VLPRIFASSIIFTIYKTAIRIIKKSDASKINRLRLDQTRIMLNTQANMAVWDSLTIESVEKPVCINNKIGNVNMKIIKNLRILLFIF